MVGQSCTEQTPKSELRNRFGKNILTALKQHIKRLLYLIFEELFFRFHRHCEEGVIPDEAISQPKVPVRLLKNRRLLRNVRSQ
jgi:hypothetical protein